MLLYSIVKDDVQEPVEIQNHTRRIHGWLFPPNYEKDPEKKENYNSTPGSFSKQLGSNSSPPADAAGEEAERL